MSEDRPITEHNWSEPQVDDGSIVADTSRPEFKGQKLVIDMNKAKVVFRSCPDNDHDWQPDPTEVDFEAVKCSKCGLGRLVRRKM